MLDLNLERILEFAKNSSLARSERLWLADLAPETSSKEMKYAYSREERRTSASHVGDTW